MSAASASSTLVADFAPPRTAHAFTGYARFDTAGEPSGTVLRCVVNDPVACTMETFLRLDKNKRVSFTILAITKTGWSTAPYTKNKEKRKGKAVRDEDPKPLFVEGDMDTDLHVLKSFKVYNFNKGSTTFDKGERDDESVSTIHVGQTLTFFLSKYLYPAAGADKAMVFPQDTDVIQRFTIVDLMLSPSHNQSDGFGCKIGRVAVHPSSLYSYMTPGALGLFPTCPMEASENATRFAELCVPMSQCVERSRQFMYAKLKPGAYITRANVDDVDVYRITREDGEDVVPGILVLDVLGDVLSRYTNCPEDATVATTFLDMAISAGALSVYVMYDSWFCKGNPAFGDYRAIPLVDVDVFLASIDFPADVDSATARFPISWTLPDVGALEFVVETLPVADTTPTIAIPAPDLSLVSEECGPVRRGYVLHVFECGTSDSLLDLVFNAAPVRVGGSAVATGRRTQYKRKHVEL